MSARLVDKNGRTMRRPLGFVERDHVPETLEESGAVSHTQRGQPNNPVWRGEGQHFEKEPHAE